MVIDGSLAEEYWRAVTDGERPLPELGDDPVAAFLALLEHTREEDAEGAFELIPPRVADPYPGIALVDVPTAEMEAWAAEVAGLIPFTSSKLKDYVLYVDTVADPDGNHRVYPFVGDSPAEEIASLDEALRWMTAAVLYCRGKVGCEAIEEVDADLEPPGEWEWSGATVFCHLRDLPLSAAYQAWSMRSWPSFDLRSTAGAGAGHAGAARIAMITAVESVLRSRTLGVRPADGAEVSEPHRRLLDQLEDLTAAVVGGRPPKIVTELAEGKDKKWAELAQAWLSRFEAAGAIAELRPVEDTASMLRRAIAEALTELAKEGDIELSDGAIEPLLEELAMAALEASNPKHTLRKLRAALLHSDHVEEVYAGDLELEAAFRRALGG